MSSDAHDYKRSSDGDTETTPPACIAVSDTADGRTIIYDEYLLTAWISSDVVIPLAEAI
ncbi:MAG: hypothetical protein M8354_03630 [Halalkalicoccus sp.]|nr:hypothetical protein [Halalkalicoccus sp.]